MPSNRPSATASSATAGTIAKFSLVSGSWVANGTYSTGAGGFGLLAADNGNGAELYFTTGNGATAPNSVVHLTDGAGFNATINITATQTLYTTGTNVTVKGISFAPVATTGNADLSALTLSAGSLTPPFAAGTTSYTATVTAANLGTTKLSGVISDAGGARALTVGTTGSLGTLALTSSNAARSNAPATIIIRNENSLCPQ